MTKILIDNVEVSEEEYLQRVTIVENEDEFCDEFLELFDCLGIDPYGENISDIDDFVDRVSIAYLNFLDFMDLERIDQYIC